MRLLSPGLLLAVLLGGCGQAETPPPTAPPIAQVLAPSPTLIPTYSMPRPTATVAPTTASSEARLPTSVVARPSATTIVITRPSATMIVAIPDLTAVPEAAAPGRLGDVSLPDTRDDIEALFARLPQSVLNQVRLTLPGDENADTLSAYYGDPDRTNDSALPMVFQAIDVGNALPEHLSAAHAIVQLAATSPGTLGRDGENYWFAQELSAEQDAGPEPATQYALSWASRDGQWLYAVLASSPAKRDALLAAIIATATVQ